MKARINLLLALFVLVGAIEVSATTRPLSLDEAIETALRQNKNVAIAKLGVQKAEAQVTEAFGNALPSLNLSAGYTHNIQLPVFFFPNPTTGEIAPLRFGLANAYNVTAQFQQLLFNSAVFTGIGASKIYADAAKAQFDAVTAEVVTETKKKYYQALAARELVIVSVATYENAIETQKTITALFNEGLVAEFDKIRSDVAVANIQPMVVDAQSGQYNALAALQSYLALDLTDTISLSSSGFATPEEAPLEETAIALAIKENFDLKALAQQVEVSREFVNVYRSDYYPTVMAIGQWQNQGQSATFSKWYSASSTFVGLNFSVNLFNGFKTSSKVEQANVDYLTAQQRYQQVSDLVKLQMRTTVNQIRSAKLRIDAQKSTVGQAQRGFDISKIRYTEGSGSLLEINDAETALTRAKVNEIMAVLDYYVTRAEYERTTGQIDEKYRRMVR
ncbi:MAG: TolC family protein [Candidatus Kapabacteria bacterium]|nr:TolC family protein [Candidatus Kapabacteria bacterium]